MDALTEQVSTINLIECPRDAMQGWKKFIPTKKKIEYINSLLKVGFHTIDFGSFVSPKAIPQMADTKEVIPNLALENSKTKLLAIVANLRGAEEAIVFNQIHYLGFPFSISETFQQRNTNSSIDESLKTVEQIQKLCINANKELVVYMSMAFGNPYGDEYNSGILFHWTKEIMQRGIKIISLSDTVGVASPEQISFALQALVPNYRQITFGVHLHSTSLNWQTKIEAAFNNGCTRFDGALKGIGGCPMANDELLGNMNTEWMISYFKEKEVLPLLDMQALKNSVTIAEQIFV
jgi:hydroxymethylglutaryl-CoA lyase